LRIRGRIVRDLKFSTFRKYSYRVFGQFSDFACARQSASSRVLRLPVDERVRFMFFAFRTSGSRRSLLYVRRGEPAVAGGEAVQRDEAVLQEGAAHTAINWKTFRVARRLVEHDQPHYVPFSDHKQLARQHETRTVPTHRWAVERMTTVRPRYLLKRLCLFCPLIKMSLLKQLYMVDNGFGMIYICIESKSNCLF